MNICKHCEEIFSEPRIEDHWETAYEATCPSKIAVCPHCGSDDIRTAQRCGLCGEWQEQEYCEECMDDLMRTLNNLGLILMKQFAAKPEVVRDAILAAMERSA